MLNASRLAKVSLKNVKTVQFTILPKTNVLRQIPFWVKQTPQIVHAEWTYGEQTSIKLWPFHSLSCQMKPWIVPMKLWRPGIKPRNNRLVHWLLLKLLLILFFEELIQTCHWLRFPMSQVQTRHSSMKHSQTHRCKRLKTRPMSIKPALLGSQNHL